MISDSAGAPLPGRWDPAWIARRAGREGYRDGPAVRGAHWVLRNGLRAARLYARGYRNYQAVRLTRIEHGVDGWPRALDGFRILQVSDLHLDLDAALLPPVMALLADVECELAAFTGDFFEGPAARHPAMLDALAAVLGALRRPACGCFGVLGNHDTAASAAAIERLGLPVLVNESVRVGRGSQTFALAGVDDAYHFRLADVAAAARGCPDGLPRILLSHSPQVAPAAAAAGFSLMLGGHTHGGQVCLPGGRSLVTMPDIPRPLFRGPWRVGRLLGYTSTGTGACHIPVRFNCPPEIVLHTLRAQA